MFTMKARPVHNMLKGPSPWLLILLLLASATLNVALSAQLKSRPHRDGPDTLQMGSPVPAFLSFTSGGTVHRKTFDANVPTILYYFSPSCSWCERNWANVQALAAASQGRYRWVGVSTVPVDRTFLQSRGLDFEVVSGVADDVLNAFRFSVTPQTLVVSPDNRVVRSWTGAYRGQLADHVQSFFGVKLPGVATPATSPLKR
jgi:peroxiredoxin